MPPPVFPSGQRPAATPRAIPAQPPLKPTPPPPRVVTHGADYRGQSSMGLGPPYQSGVASYYHDSLAGNHTANGEIYDPRILSAAHRTLAFGTVVDVVRPDGRWVRVKVNDRGPFAGKRRIIDLSRHAAERVGMIQAGVVEVRIYIVAQPSPKARRGR